MAPAFYARSIMRTVTAAYTRVMHLEHGRALAKRRQEPPALGQRLCLTGSAKVLFVRLAELVAGRLSPLDMTINLVPSLHPSYRRFVLFPIYRFDGGHPFIVYSSNCALKLCCQDDSAEDRHHSNGDGEDRRKLTDHTSFLLDIAIDTSLCSGSRACEPRTLSHLQQLAGMP